MPPLRALVPLFLALLVTGLPALAQDPPATDGAAAAVPFGVVRDASVDVLTNGMDAMTDRNGVFVIRGTPRGTLSAAALADGLAPGVASGWVPTESPEDDDVVVIGDLTPGAEGVRTEVTENSDTEVTIVVPD